MPFWYSSMIPKECFLFPALFYQVDGFNIYIHWLKRRKHLYWLSDTY